MWHAKGLAPPAERAQPAGLPPKQQRPAGSRLQIVPSSRGAGGRLASEMESAQGTSTANLVTGFMMATLSRPCTLAKQTAVAE